MVIHDVEQGTDEWFKLRAGIPTGSEFGKLVTGTGALSKSIDEFAKTLACEKHNQGPVDPFHGTKWTTAGKEDEDDAAEHYAIMSELPVTKVGFVTDDDITHGASPDRLVGDDGMLELKRLKGSELVDMAYYVKKWNKLAPKYVPQTQGQMMVCERKWCDVMFYNPATPPVIVRVYPIPDIAIALRSQIRVVNRMRDKIIEDLGW